MNIRTAGKKRLQAYLDALIPLKQEVQKQVDAVLAELDESNRTLKELYALQDQVTNQTQWGLLFSSDSQTIYNRLNSIHTLHKVYKHDQAFFIEIIQSTINHIIEFQQKHEEEGLNTKYSRIHFVLTQIESMELIVQSLNSTVTGFFEMALFANGPTNIARYDVVNGNDGSWAVAISDENNYLLAKYTKALFKDFQANWNNYFHGLDVNAETITIWKQLSATSPRAVLQNAIDQINGGMKFYRYIVKKNSPLNPTETKTYNTYHQEVTDELITLLKEEGEKQHDKIAELLKTLFLFPSSYCRNEDNRVSPKEKNIVRPHKDSNDPARFGLAAFQRLEFNLQ
jgi:hypothetical protein